MENRFLEMDNYLKQVAARRPGQINNKRSTGSSSLRNRPYTKSFTAVDYKVPGLFDILKQPSGLVCWATVTTMMVNWKRQKSATTETVLTPIGSLYVTKFKNNESLMPDEKIPFLRAAGLAFEYPQSHSIEGWEQLLRSYGPLWVTTDEDPSGNFAIHARIITGIQGDGTPDNTNLIIIDPAKGTQYPEKFSNFLVKYEQEVIDSGAMWSGRIQVVHWPAGVGTAKSFSNEKTQTNTLSAEGLQMIKGFEGFMPNLYNDPVGHCTVGYGHLLHLGNCNGDASEQPFLKGITEQQATQLLIEKSYEFQRAVNETVKVELNANQFDALVSFAYNIGIGAFKNSTLVKLLNQGKYEAVPTELKKWTKGTLNGQKVDLPGLVSRRNTEANLFTAPLASSQLSYGKSKTGYSVPLYDTGEHAILGEFINAATSGPLASVHALLPTTTYQLNTVPFTYGQIITMGDFYTNYSDCQNASATELTRLKTLITRSENHYKNSILGIGAAAKDVSNSEWGDPTVGIGQRYIDLAITNNSHFAPPPAGTTTTLAYNKQSWETYHAKAIQIARAGTNSTALDDAYPVNAFGDHFLTDAFSAGHLINKEQVMKRFISNVLTGGKVNSAGDKMFERIADGALAVPAINKKLGRFEVISSSWYEPNWDLNDTGTFVPEVFYRILVRVMEDTAHNGSSKIANLAVKAIHDYLNTYQAGGVKGVPVKNKKGNSWNLTGDGTLNLDNIKIIQLAVKQSVLNIEDSVSNSATPLSTFYQKVWDYVPDLSDPVTSKIVNDAITIYTNPSSDALVKKAVTLIEGELDTLLNELLSAKLIQCRKKSSARTVAECEKA